MVALEKFASDDVIKQDYPHPGDNKRQNKNYNKAFGFFVDIAFVCHLSEDSQNPNGTKGFNLIFLKNYAI